MAGVSHLPFLIAYCAHRRTSTANSGLGNACAQEGVDRWTCLQRTRSPVRIHW